MSKLIELLIENGNRMSVDSSVIKSVKKTVTGCAVTIDDGSKNLRTIPTNNRYEDVIQFVRSEEA